MKRIDANTDLETLTAAVCAALAAKGIEAVLTGGAVVSLYTHNEYQSYDLDFISGAGRAELDAAMQTLGFARQAGRHYAHPACRYLVEFPSGPLMAGAELLTRSSERASPAGRIRLLTPTDAVKDRLAGFLHWSDRQSLEQALAICRAQPVNFSELVRWARREKQAERWAVFADRFAKLEPVKGL